MEKLSLEKFSDVQLKRDEMRVNFGSGSGYQESCGTEVNWYISDTQTDYYSDNCEPGVYNLSCSTTEYSSWLVPVNGMSSTTCEQ